MAVSLLPALLLSCAQSAHQTGRYLIDEAIPKDFQRQVDRSVSFSELRKSPSSYVGRTVMLSGIVLNMKRVKDHAEIEILQLPTNTGAVLSGDRSRSEGRFIAMKQDTDPAVIEAGTPVTVVGEVSGTTVKSLDESEYTYPVLEVKYLVEWDKTGRSTGYDPYDMPYYGGAYGFYPNMYGFYPWGLYGYSPYYPFFPFGSVAPPPSPPPPQMIPPQFKKK
jgi:outer membrane lipoprotein